jgi:hypothetical protein
MPPAQLNNILEQVNRILPGLAAIIFSSTKNPDLLNIIPAQLNNILEQKKNFCTTQQHSCVPQHYS